MVLITSEKSKIRSIEIGQDSKSLFTMIKSTVIKDLQIWRRYKANMIGGFVQAGATFLLFYLMATVFKFRGLGFNQHDRILFYYVALILTMFMSTSIYAPINSVTKDLYNGTLEYIFSTPANKYGYFLGVTIADVIKNLLYVIPMIAVLYVIADLTLLTLVINLVIVALAVIVFVALGVLLGQLGIMWKRINSINNLLSTVLNFFSGAFIPLQSLPIGFKWFAYLFPHTFAFDLMRTYSIDGWQPLLPIWIEYLLLAIHFLLYTSLTIWLMKKVEARAKDNGLHLI